MRFPEQCIAYVCKMVLRGLAFMHRSHRLHRDIKSDNILVDFEGYADGLIAMVIIINFSWSSGLAFAVM